MDSLRSGTNTLMMALVQQHRSRRTRFQTTLVCATTLAFVGVVSACTKSEPGGSTPTRTGSSTPASPASITSAPPSSPSPPADSPYVDWVEAVRLESWDEAAVLMDALPEDRRSRPEVRYARARVALASKDWSQALSLLEGLEHQLTALARDIRQHKAEAQLHGGQAEQAALFFAKTSSVRGLTHAALAWSRANNPKQARATIDRAIHLAKNRVDDDAVQARRVRTQLAETTGDQAALILDLRFIARHARDTDMADAASLRLRQLDPKQRLSSEEHMDRAITHARRGHADRAEEEIDRAVKAPGGPPSAIDQLLARARAAYNSRDDYANAAQLYEQAAGVRGAHVPEARYFAAKAWSRANDNDRGIELYNRVIREHPSSPWAERAGYYGSRLQRFQGRWTLAEKGYRTYLKRHPRGMFVKGARSELALCLLLSGDYKNARSAFEKLAKEEKELLSSTSHRYLAAVAALGEGKKDLAANTWRRIIAEQPLSWFSLVSAARLASLGHPPAPPIPPALATEQPPLHVKLPPTVQLLRDIGLDRDAESMLRSMEDALSKGYGGRKGEALCAAYGQLHTGARLHRIGQRHVPVRLVQKALSPSTRWAWECLYPRPFQATITRVEQQEKLPPGLVYAVIRQESAFNPDATSPVGARGLMQLMPKTAEKTSFRLSKQLDPDTITAPAVNLSLGSHYLGMLLRMMNGSVPLSVGAYNAGPVAVGRWVARTQDVPMDVWVALVPYRETRHYIWRVVGNWARYRYLELGESAIPTIDLKIPEGIQIPADAY